MISLKFAKSLRKRIVFFQVFLTTCHVATPHPLTKLSGLRHHPPPTPTGVRRPSPHLYRYFTVKPLNAIFISTDSLLPYLEVFVLFQQVLKYCSDFWEGDLKTSTTAEAVIWLFCSLSVSSTR